MGHHEEGTIVPVRRWEEVNHSTFPIERRDRLSKDGTFLLPVMNGSLR